MIISVPSGGRCFTALSLIQSPVSLVYIVLKQNRYWDFPGGLVIRNLPCNAGDSVQSEVQALRSHVAQSNDTQEPQLAVLRQEIPRGPTKT